MEWCRACGAPQDEPSHSDTCAACDVHLGADIDLGSRVGLVYELKGRMRLTRQLAICTVDSGSELVLHVSEKDHAREIPADELPDHTNLIPHSLSPAGRLMFAITPAPNGPFKSDWQADHLRLRVSELMEASVPARRRLLFDSFDQGWDRLIDWIDLTDSEKTWYRAHHAAAVGELDTLRDQLSLLPSTGYPDRFVLLLPYLPSIAEKRSEWIGLIEGWVDNGVPGAGQLEKLISRDWHEAAAAGIETLRASDLADSADDWANAADSFGSATTISPLRDDCPNWDLAHIYAKGMSGIDVTKDAEILASAPTSMLDDLVDAGTLTDQFDGSVFPEETRLHLLARLAPEELDDEQLRAVDHEAELARRAMLARNRATIRSLEDSARVRHYEALLDVLDGAHPDESRLDSEIVAILQTAEQGRRSIIDGGTGIPEEVILDPTLWPLYADLARDGMLQVPKTGEAQVSLGHWADTQGVLGRLWRGDWSGAAQLGERLYQEIANEKHKDEVMNLTAFALDQLGRHEEALSLLESALEGDYSEALLINASIVASTFSAESAAPHFAKIIREAPTSDLKVAAMLRAVSIWDSSESDFPEPLIGPLESVLALPMDVDDFALLARVAADSAPNVLINLSDPGDELSGPYLIQQALARFNLGQDFYSNDLASAFADAFHKFGRPPWFESEWKRLISLITESTFVTFGEGMGTAIFVDTIHMNAPELFSQFERFLLMPQAGAHMAAYFAESNEFLSEEAIKKFFFLPIEEFLAHVDSYDSEPVTYLADNMSRTLLVAAISYLDETRKSTATPYNALVERLRWDQQNLYVIRQEMANILAIASDHQSQVERMLDRLKRLPINDSDHHDRVTNLTAALKDWRDETIQLRANL